MGHADFPRNYCPMSVWVEYGRLGLPPRRVQMAVIGGGGFLLET